jgi:TraL protein
MKIEKIIIIATLLVSSCSYGATCRSGAAAAEGAQSAYDAAIAKINSENDALKNSSEVIGTCISAVTGVVTVPTFPDLGSIWSDIMNQVCKTASDKISDSYNDVIGGINNNINDLMNGVNNKVDSTVNDAKGSVKNIWN